MFWNWYTSFGLHSVLLESSVTLINKFKVTAMLDRIILSFILVGALDYGKKTCITWWIGFGYGLKDVRIKMAVLSVVEGIDR